MRSWTLAAAIIVFCTGGCNPRNAGNLAQDVKSVSRHTGQALGSASLAAKVNTVLSLRKGVDMSGLHVDAQDGVVTLSGHVRNVEERRRVVQTVDGIRWVDKIVNQIRIQAPESGTDVLGRLRR